MSEGMCKAVLIGNVGKDLELEETRGGTAYTRFSLACNESYTDDKGDRQTRTEWVNCVQWGKMAGHLSKHLKKGSQVYVEGRIETTSYEKEGQKQYSTSVNVRKVLFLGKKPNGGNNAN